MRKLKRRRRISMTSLIDVIFLLLLFFMLTSTFTRFAEVELSASGTGGGGTADKPPLFLQLDTDEIRVNGQIISLEALPPALLDVARAQGEVPVVLVSLRDAVTAQRLTDLLVVLRKLPDLKVTVLEAA